MIFTITEDPPPPKCPVCGDTGWKSVTSKGHTSGVVRCECRFELRLQRLLAAANIPRRYKHCTLADFDTSFHGASQSLTKAKLDVDHFVKEYPVEKAGLLLIGPIGVGKTHLAVGIVQELIRSKHRPCLFRDYRELLKEIQDSYNPTVQTTELEILRPVFEAEVLVLDELGAIRPSQWVWDTVSHILNYRYNEKKTTIITTNFPNRPSKKEEEKQKREAEERKLRTKRSKEDAEAEAAMREETLGDRITDSMRSRLHEMCKVIEIDGKDFRISVRNVRV